MRRAATGDLARIMALRKLHMPAAAVRRRSPTVDGDQHRLGGLYATPVGWQIFHGFIREEPVTAATSPLSGRRLVAFWM